MKKIIFTFLLITTTFVFAQEYVGSDACKSCHSSKYNDWKQSGHPYKIQKLQGGNGPVFPVLTAQKTVGNVVNYTLKSGIPNPPAGLNWSEISFVLGGYHSNARFLDKEGYLILGDNRQYNLPTNKWVTYTQSAPGKSAYNYSCYKCHTTGPSKTKTADFQAYPGIEGSWAEAGVGCENCHGPAKNHISDISQKPTVDVDCSRCHARDRNEGTTTYNWNKRVEWQAKTVNNVSSGFIRHREQGDMLLASKHGKAGFTCTTCHDPHKGIYFDLGSIKPASKCENCHPNHEIKGHDVAKTKAECTDCHMPFAARNGDQLTPYISEQSTHYWKVLTDPITMFDNLEEIGNNANPPVKYKFIKVDQNGLSGITLDYTCMQCHTTKDVAWASTYAKGIHKNGIPTNIVTSEMPTAYSLSQNFPNPFNPSTKISFAIPKSTNVSLNIYTVNGQLVKTVINNNLNAGWHEVTVQANDLASGVYIYRIQTDDWGYSRKMILMK